MEQFTVEERLRIADALYEKRQWPNALEAYEEILHDHPGVAWAYSRIGAIRAQSGDAAGAEAALNKALELDPRLPQAHSNLGNLLYERGDYPGALERFKTAAELQPDNPIFQENLHAAYKRLNRLPEAVAALKRAHRLGRVATRHTDATDARRLLTRAKARAGCLTRLIALVLAGLIAVLVA